MPSLVIQSPADVDVMVASIRSAAQLTVRSLQALLANESDSLQVLRLMKFSGIGNHPTEDRPLNIIEQVNQTFTYLASAEAARWVPLHHPDAQGVRLNLGTHSGLDLESIAPGLVAAEIFAATHPNSNDKVRKDVARMVAQEEAYVHRYVFFSCPDYRTMCRQSAFERDGVQVWSLPTEQLIKPPA